MPKTAALLLSVAAVSAWAQDAPSAAIQRRTPPPARIVSFTAQPASVRAGQPVLLVWATENPIGSNIDQGVGRVTPRGSQQVTPLETTTYTLTIGGPNNTSLTKSVTVMVSGEAPAELRARVATSAKHEVPRMADGKPDFSGVYNNTAPGGPLPAPAPPVLKPGAEKFKVVRGTDDAGLYSDCMPTGVPQAFAVPYQVQFVQSANTLAILHEYPGIFRTVPLDGAPHHPDLDPTWMGDSIGHWEGDTLVIDTTGFNDKTELPGGFKHTEDLHVVERLRRPQPDLVEYEATIEDKNVFAGPWKVTRRFGLRTDLKKVDEFVCENNRDYSKLFKK
jgi:hypothetical protein